MFFSESKTIFADIQSNIGDGMEKLRTSFQNVRNRSGLLYAVASCFFFATSTALVHVVQEIQAVQTVFYRSLFQLIFTIPMLIYQGVNPLPDRKNFRETTLLFLRGAAGSAALCFQFYSFQHMAVSDATVIIFSSPIFTGILAYYILGETWSRTDVLSTALCFIGVLLIAHPVNFFVSSFQSRQHLIYSLVAFTGAILTSFSIIALKKLSRVHFLIPSFYLALVGTIATGLLCLYPGVLREIACGHHIILVVLIGLCAIGGQCFLTKALQMEKASTVALVRTFDIVLAFVCQLVFFDDEANLYSISGAILVSLCNVLVILGDSKSSNEDKKTIADELN